MLRILPLLVMGISVCHTRAVSSLGQSSFCLFIAVGNEAFMSSDSWVVEDRINGESWIRGSGRRILWPNWRYHPCIYL